MVGRQREGTAVVAFALSKPLRDYKYFTINCQDYYRMLRIRHLVSTGNYSSVVGNRCRLVYYIYRRLDVLAQSIKQEGLTNQQLRSS